MASTRSVTARCQPSSISGGRIIRVTLGRCNRLAEHSTPLALMSAMARSGSGEFGRPEERQHQPVWGNRVAIFSS
jgi:hypothetical protein